jgi:hypothetical protein
MSDPKNRVPPIPREIVEHLERVFRPRLPQTPEFTLQQVGFAAGQASVIAHLRTALDRQEEAVIKPNP